MFSRTLAKTAVVAALAIAMAACSQKKNDNMTESSEKVDAAVAAENKLSDAGCKFESIFLPQDQVNIVNRLKCEGDKLFDQKEAIGAYINELSEIMKDKERTDLGELQTKMDGAVTKFLVVDSAWRKLVSIPVDPRLEIPVGSNEPAEKTAKSEKQAETKPDTTWLPPQIHR